ncbi:MAG: hypothetical protein COA45_01080 [Zetaproteobacteria bacterium]|nr:MAG: hypothetical protein COA45_01080 [Zetaproteobacteria bacterium]
MIRLIPTLLIMLILPINAMAVEINAQGAQKLKTSFEDILAYQKEVNEAFSSLQVIYEGELTVTQEKEYYTITLPRILLKGQNTEDTTDTEAPVENQTLDMGVISINAMPDDKAGYWKMVLSLPQSMIMHEDGAEDFTIHFEKQNIIALFDDTLGYFIKMNVNLSGVSFTTAEKDSGISVGNLQFYINLEKGEANTFSGPAHILISNLLIASADIDESVKIEELKFSSTIAGLVLPTLLEYKAKLLKYADVFKSLEDIEGEDNVKDIDSQRLSEMMLDMYDIKMDSVSIEYSLKNMELSPDLTDEDREFDTLKLSSAFMGFGSNDMNSENGSLNIKMGYDGIDVQSSTPDNMYSTFLPTQTNFDIKIENIPYSTLSQMAKNSVTSVIGNPDTAQMVGFGALMKLPAILAQANTQVIVKDNLLKNGIYDVSLNGNVTTDLTAIMGFSAKFKTVFKGLDDLLSKIPRDPENTEAADAIKTLGKLKSLGKTNTDSNGKTVYTFDFEATPQGAFLLNGQDTSTINFD